jgi:hypothetical protein
LLKDWGLATHRKSLNPKTNRVAFGWAESTNLLFFVRFTIVDDFNVSIEADNGHPSLGPRAINFEARGRDDVFYGNNTSHVQASRRFEV